MGQKALGHMGLGSGGVPQEEFRLLPLSSLVVFHDLGDRRHQQDLRLLEIQVGDSWGSKEMQELLLCALQV